MLDITPNDVADLTDAELRDLVGRLCEAEVRRHGYSPAYVRSGGHQDAPDGGVDVSVSLPAGATIDGFIPRSTTVFQVKKSPMPKAKILAEMKKRGRLRPAIEALRRESGAYVIVSAESATGNPLKNRQEAMRSAAGDGIEVLFLGRDEVATWLRQYPGLTLWVKEKINRPLSGWSGYRRWASPADATEAAYLLEGLTIHSPSSQSALVMAPLDGITKMRGILNQPSKSLRLVGLSGLGKTRLVEALFDRAVGEDSLDPALVCYADAGQSPDPPPVRMAHELISHNQAVILVVDNCGAPLHRELTEICQRPESKVSVITVEYDVRDDLPQGTDVFRLDAASEELIGKLLARWYPKIHPVTAQTILTKAGGNARLAHLLGSTVGRNERIAEMTDEEFVGRLLFQNDPRDENVRLEAQALSLVYGFHGDDEGPTGELASLGWMIDRTPEQMHLRAVKLFEKGVTQKRGPWRAVLPPALGNRLAAQGL